MKDKDLVNCSDKVRLDCYDILHASWEKDGIYRGGDIVPFPKKGKFTFLGKGTEKFAEVLLVASIIHEKLDHVHLTRR